MSWNHPNLYEFNLKNPIKSNFGIDNIWGNHILPSRDKHTHLYKIEEDLSAASFKSKECDVA